jgi:hypothetical protein
MQLYALSSHAKRENAFQLSRVYPLAIVRSARLDANLENAYQTNVTIWWN